MESEEMHTLLLWHALAFSTTLTSYFLWYQSRFPPTIPLCQGREEGLSNMETPILESPTILWNVTSIRAKPTLVQWLLSPGTIIIILYYRKQFLLICFITDLV